MKKKVCKYYIDTCFHCNRIKDTFEKLSNEYKDSLEFENKKVGSPEMEKKYNLHIYPTVVIYEGDKEISRIEGVIPPEMLEDFVKGAM